MVTNKDFGRRLVIYEEGWDALENEASLERMVEQWKLARSYGLVNLLILHKLADLEMAGNAGSSHRAKARSLLGDAEIRIVYRRKTGQLDSVKQELGLTERETQLVKNLKKAHGLWKIGNRSFIVRNRWTLAEAPIFSTDERMKK